MSPPRPPAVACAEEGRGLAARLGNFGDRGERRPAKGGGKGRVACLFYDGGGTKAARELARLLGGGAALRLPAYYTCVCLNPTHDGRVEILVGEAEQPQRPVVERGAVRRSVVSARGGGTAEVRKRVSSYASFVNFTSGAGKETDQPVTSRSRKWSQRFLSFPKRWLGVGALIVCERQRFFFGNYTSDGDQME